MGFLHLLLVGAVDLLSVLILRAMGIIRIYVQLDYSGLVLPF